MSAFLDEKEMNSKSEYPTEPLSRLKLRDYLGKRDEISDSLE